ncbi:hypothetical protein [Bacteriovorax sp. Seq25_V]|uniref:hypothetical protein n=1 Tax=Bacteriovorax sp. Seq25_V TaxID=1201288 RepID=UPI00038A1DD6|nr:hypothetical protein [Bacteriovorax sp. Seq25_V]EQC46121.1 hypothetical protein M900_1768 [Bacteriovorax sp. Seq25_V]
MIFNKKIYSSSGTINSFFKRLNLLSLNGVSRSEVTVNSLLFPVAKSKISESDISELNEVCHTNAFLFEKEAKLNLALCNSCGDCSFHQKVEMRPVKISGQIVSL